MTNPTNRTSQLPGFYKVTVAERRTLVSEATGTPAHEIEKALDQGGLDAETADKFVENVLGTYALPYGVTLNVRVNGNDHVVPMVVEAIKAWKPGNPLDPATTVGACLVCDLVSTRIGG